jgi:hypothetical protein
MFIFGEVQGGVRREDGHVTAKKVCLEYSFNSAACCGTHELETKKACGVNWTGLGSSWARPNVLWFAEKQVEGGIGLEVKDVRKASHCLKKVSSHCD